MRHLEHEHQKALFIWWSLESSRRGIDHRLMWATPNGGFRHIGTARRLKAEGVRAGVPDVFLAIPNGFHAGLFIELKSPAKTSRVSESQREIKCLLEKQGYACRICYGWDEAREAIEGYLKPLTKYSDAKEKKEFVNLP
jgi:hypothetical protein